MKEPPLFIWVNIFGVSYNGRNFIGRTQGRISWETKKNGIPFNRSGVQPISRTATQTDQQAVFSNMPLGTNLFKEQVVKENGLTTKVRVRMQYSAVNAITGQILGPWRYHNAYMSGGLGFWSLPLPLRIVQFTVAKTTGGPVLQWQLANVQVGDKLIIERSSDRNNFIPVAQQSASDINSYKDVTAPGGTILYYRLKAQAVTGKITYAVVAIIATSRNWQLQPMGQQCRLVSTKPCTVIVYNEACGIVHQQQYGMGTYYLPINL